MLPARLPGRTVRSGRETRGDLSVGEPRVRQTGIRSSAGEGHGDGCFLQCAEQAGPGTGIPKESHISASPCPEPRLHAIRPRAGVVGAGPGSSLSFRFRRRVGTAPVGWLCRETVDAEQQSRQTGNKKPPPGSGGFFVLTHLDSNQERQNQNLQCYHYTMGQCFNGTNVIKKIFSTKNLR